MVRMTLIWFREYLKLTERSSKLHQLSRRYHAIFGVVTSENEHRVRLQSLCQQINKLATGRGRWIKIPNEGTKWRSQRFKLDHANCSRQSSAPG